MNVSEWQFELITVDRCKDFAQKQADLLQLRCIFILFYTLIELLDLNSTRFVTLHFQKFDHSTDTHSNEHKNEKVDHCIK